LQTEAVQSGAPSGNNEGSDGNNEGSDGNNEGSDGNSEEDSSDEVCVFSCWLI
jgi:hypothetical protein